MNWARTARPGDKTIYHIGFVRYDLETIRVAFGFAWQAHEAGLVFLAQRRVLRGPHAGYLAYEATRISPRTALKLRLIDKDRRAAMERESGAQMFKAELGRAA